ncbi:MAG: hypothetical protein JWL79_86 [Frankiales bacterium]|nr:hypothetical protein [Frankiales bacterium]
MTTDKSEDELRRAVFKLYDIFFEREPDHDGLNVNTQALREDGFERLFDAFASSDEFRQRRALNWSHYRTQGTVVPWSVQLSQEQAAQHLLVTFPGLCEGRWVRRDYRLHAVGHLPMHRLDIGSDTDLLLGPQGHNSGAELAVEIVQERAAALGIPMSRVVCAGPSFHGSCALYVGFKAGAGHVIVGAPGVRLGSILDSVRANGSGDPAVLRRIEGVVEVPRAWSETRAMLDSLIIDAALSSQTRTSVEVFASERDVFFNDSAWLVMQLARRTKHSATLTKGDYAHHGVGDEPFHEFLVSRVDALIEKTHAATAQPSAAEIAGGPRQMPT